VEIKLKSLKIAKYENLRALTKCYQCIIVEEGRDPYDRYIGGFNFPVYATECEVPLMHFLTSHHIYSKLDPLGFDAWYIIDPSDFKTCVVITHYDWAKEQPISWESDPYLKLLKDTLDKEAA
jgi:hypothetical protein